MRVALAGLAALAALSLVACSKTNTDASSGGAPPDAATPPAAADATAAPQADANAPGNAPVKDTHQENAGPASSGANSFTEGQARDHIAKSGYTNVSGLTQDSNGVWHGTATKNGKSGPVALDFKGNVVTSR